MLRPRFASCCVALAGLAVLVAAPASAGAQQAVKQAAQHASPAPSPAAQDSIELFAKTHLAVSTLRDRYQAQFAEPQNKKREVQDALHEKFLGELQTLLKAHGFTDASFAQMTRFVSVDSAARRAFEEALAREAKK